MRPWNITKYNLPFLIQKLESLDPTKQWQIVIQESKTKRSLEQNSRLWSLYKSVGDFVGYTPDEIHSIMAFKFLRGQKQVGEKVEEYLMSTTQLNTEQMAEYQSNIEIWASQMGWSWND
ncbi:hypothetical protein UFOVP263_19 [uncultured Caudovirales phage]|uniref:Recombinase NinB n=1 Tax=uncultured Caudovirales phage TaxID=2100421 RepID=A0A6J5TDN2_9CAUD|nr:hypothetical protein UFOVP263_19 [uncultured Caudovirales phage]CAB4242106.1 hypothetical protein UFOVP91_44 [uncultured Caudovirales phage]